MLAPANFALSIFENATSTRPRAVAVPWPRFAAALTHHTEREHKDGRAFSPVTYRPGATRGNAHVERVDALVFDYDHRHPAWDRLAPHECVAYTTHSHAPGEPRWRIVLPTVRSLAPADYPEVWRRAVAALAPDADRACRDLARLHYLPACRPGGPRDARWTRGAFLDTAALPPLPPAPEPERPGRNTRPVGDGHGEAPGTHFARVTTWEQIVAPHGWRLVGTRGQTQDFLRPENGRPRTARRSATAGGGGEDVFYVFSSNAAPLEPHTSYTRFGLYAALTHGGDFRAAARALASRGYGAARVPSLAQAPPARAAVLPPLAHPPASRRLPALAEAMAAEMGA